MMKLSHLLKAFLKTKIILPLAAIALLLLTFQNCGRTKFTSIAQTSLASTTSTPVSPICGSARPQESEYVACLPPLQNSLLAVKKYAVVCQINGSWSRSVSGPIDYSLCIGVCDPAKRLSDKENVACPAPFSNEIKGVQNYSVSCLNDGTWSRTLVGAADYLACSKSCDANTKPPSTSAVACQAPYAAILSGVQNYTVTCNSNGTWSRNLLGNIDYKNCPQACDPAKKLPTQVAALCPTSSAMLAIQNYTVTCNNNGTWSSMPSSFDTSACPVAICTPATKPPATESAACPAPNDAVKSSVLNYSVSCSGTTWVRSVPTRDDSKCPVTKSCPQPKPSDVGSKVSCQAPFSNQNLAVQNYTFTCNTTTGAYDQIATGPVNYSSCPKSCTGEAPSSSVAISCPAGLVGTAYQSYNVTCNTATGNYDVTTGAIDNSGCAPKACSGITPVNFDSVACPAPFAERNDAKKMYSVTCVNGDWNRQPTGVVDSSSCPVNDCSGSAQPSPLKSVGSCPSGASGAVTQSCSLMCSGKTWSQVNCSADDYSRCDCGANATFNSLTQACIPKLATCTPSTATNQAVACGAGMTGTKFTTTTVSCPNGPYGNSVSSTSDYNTAACQIAAPPKGTLHSYYWAQPDNCSQDRYSESWSWNYGGPGGPSGSGECHYSGNSSSVVCTGSNSIPDREVPVEGGGCYKGDSNDHTYNCSGGISGNESFYCD
ncbi:MAG: hypothetical protein H7256_05520 [Bdellovibrio sp.]|nr:hypothetical protein [Bdellovibrio sp.]